MDSQFADSQKKNSAGHLNYYFRNRRKKVGAVWKGMGVIIYIKLLPRGRCLEDDASRTMPRGRCLRTERAVRRAGGPTGRRAVRWAGGRSDERAVGRSGGRTGGRRRAGGQNPTVTFNTDKAIFSVACRISLVMSRLSSSVIFCTKDPSYARDAFRRRRVVLKRLFSICNWCKVNYQMYFTINII